MYSFRCSPPPATSTLPSPARAVPLELSLDRPLGSVGAAAASLCSPTLSHQRSVLEVYESGNRNRNRNSSTPLKQENASIQPTESSKQIPSRTNPHTHTILATLQQQSKQSVLSPPSSSPSSSSPSFLSPSSSCYISSTPFHLQRERADIQSDLIAAATAATNATIINNLLHHPIANRTDQPVPSKLNSHASRGRPTFVSANQNDNNNKLTLNNTLDCSNKLSTSASPYAVCSPELEASPNEFLQFDLEIDSEHSAVATSFTSIDLVQSPVVSASKLSPPSLTTLTSHGHDMEFRTAPLFTRTRSSGDHSHMNKQIPWSESISCRQLYSSTSNLPSTRLPRHCASGSDRVAQHPHRHPPPPRGARRVFSSPLQSSVRTEPTRVRRIQSTNGNSKSEHIQLPPNLYGYGYECQFELEL